MNEARSSPEPRPPLTSNDTESDFIDHAVVIWRYRWMIAGFCGVALATTLVISVSTAKIYESTATLLAPGEGTGSGLLGGLVAPGVLAQVPGLSIPSLTPNRDMLMSILKSRTVAKALVERFGLLQRYRARYPGDAIAALEGLTRISSSREGVIVVTVGDTDSQVAAQMANFYIEELDRLVARYSTGEAGRQRAFFTEQLARTRVDLETAEENLRRFQERHRAIALQDQTRGAIEAAARLKGEMMATEVQLQVMRTFATEANSEVVALKHRVDEMRRQLARMQYGDRLSAAPASSPDGDRRDFTVPFPKVPEIGVELVRLTRDVKVQETLVTLLTQHVEQARIAAAKDLPVVHVLDRAVAADRHARPKLRLNLSIAGVTSLFTGIVVALLMEYVKNARRRRSIAAARQRG
jgi:tyrosine-protein kinase Etk/Wzc